MGLNFRADMHRMLTHRLRTGSDSRFFIRTGSYDGGELDNLRKVLLMVKLLAGCARKSALAGCD